MAIISKKKKVYPIAPPLQKFLLRYRRYCEIPINYHDLLRVENSAPLYDSNGEDTLWETVYYRQDDMAHIHFCLKKIYALLKADGDMSVIEHLSVNRVDLCTYGNTQPFRIRIVNSVNDNFDYFYIKQADASRVYGLELEDMTSPNQVRYLVHNQTLIEEHIAGIPGEQFIKNYIDDKNTNPIRLAKEFIKFTERCFVRLLGDMHSNNFVVDITPDFDEVTYRIRAIDFDQQCYERRKAVYMPQYFQQNIPIMKIGYGRMTPQTVRQYQREEQFRMASRCKKNIRLLKSIVTAMESDCIAPIENVLILRRELADHYQAKSFLSCKNMGEVLRQSLVVALRLQ